VGGMRRMPPVSSGPARPPSQHWRPTWRSEPLGYQRWDVQKAAGVNASQLHRYFGDKQTLVRAVIAHYSRILLAGQQPLLSRLDSLDSPPRVRPRHHARTRRFAHCSSASHSDPAPGFRNSSG
jgi:hypothetical protein